MLFNVTVIHTSTAQQSELFTLLAFPKIQVLVLILTRSLSFLMFLGVSYPTHLHRTKSSSQLNVVSYVLLCDFMKFYVVLCGVMWFHVVYVVLWGFMWLYVVLCGSVRFYVFLRVLCGFMLFNVVFKLWWIYNNYRGSRTLAKLSVATVNWTIITLIDPPIDNYHFMLSKTVFPVHKLGKCLNY